MANSKRATIYFDDDLHKALRIKAAETDRSVSDLVNAALRQALSEDAEDLAAFRERASEKTMPFEEFVADLKRRGKL
ncbi:MAG: ribbon-helix-helix domain-containing protein [Gemmatimonadota bacterium]